MLGSEYNWLIRVARPAGGPPRVSLSQGTLLTLAVAAFCLLCVAARAESTAPDATIIPGMDGILEGLAIHPTTHEWYLGDVHNRCIWHRSANAADPAVKKFSSDADALLGVFALKISADGRTLWASCSAVPEMNGYTTGDLGRGFLAAYDLTTGKLSHTYALPSDAHAHVLGDFLLLADGTIYVTDSSAPIIWRLAPGGRQLEKWLENPDFKSLQGLALATDGHSMYVADYSRGLWQVNLAKPAAALLPALKDANLRGIDGLYSVPGGLIGVQNGLNPQRILSITLNNAGVPTAASALLVNHPAMTDLSLGQVLNGRFAFIANSGWELFANPAANPAPRPLTILATALH